MSSPLINPLYQHSGIGEFTANIIIYICFCVVQELLFRGVLQELLIRILKSKYKILLAIIYSNIIFASFHVMEFGSDIAMSVFLLGCIWGWLYSRHTTLIGVILCHALVGVVALFFIGVADLV